MTGSRTTSGRIPILNYHTVTDAPEPGIAAFAVRPDDFARHLDLIVANGCTALTVSGLVDLLDRDLPLPPATVVVTFDDGYEDNLTVAAPLLAARGLPATVFVTTGFLPGCPGGRIAGSLGPMLPWERLADLEAAGIEVGSHSHTHPQMDVLSRSAADREVRHSKELLEETLGHPIGSFAYPHGYATRWLQQDVRGAGFRSACGVRDAFSHRDDNRWLLSRLTVRSTTTCDQVDSLLRGAGAPTAGAGELLRTKAWRVARRARALAPAGGWPGMGRRDDGGASRSAVRLVDVELSRPLEDLAPLEPEAGGTYEELRILARLHRRPLGTVSVHVPDGGLDAARMAATIWSELAEPIRDHCTQDRLPVPETLTVAGLVDPRGNACEAPCSWRRSLGEAIPPLATLVITTCGGPGSRLTDTLRDALAQSYPRFEVVVVDNRPATSGVRDALDLGFPGTPRLRYAAEPRVGLAHARNRGAAVAHGEIVAFTDDDVEIDADWLACLVAGFDDPAVACVTGLILPLELETGAQRLLEEFGGYAKGFERRTWDCDEQRLDTPLYPYTVGAFGSGANAAFRISALLELGGFDGVLGAGTRARGGEDIDIYVRCVQSGYRIRYEPGAIVRHAHLREMAQVRQKVRDYGVGLGAMLTKHLVRNRSSAAGLLSRVPAGTVHLLSARSPKNASRSATYPSSLVLAELQGLLYGPVAYARSRVAS